MDWKNILIIISSLGGWWAERVATTIWSALNVDNNVSYLTFYYNKNEYQFSGEKYCLYEKLSNNILIKVWKMFSRAYKIYKYKRKLNIDCCISFMEESNVPNILSKLFKHKSKTIVSIRVSVDSMPGLYKWFVKYLYPFADYIVPNSYEERDNLIENYWIDEWKVVTIYNPLNFSVINKLKNEEIKEQVFDNDKFTFITTWRLSLQKDQKFLIDVYKKFHEKYKNTQFLILWEGEEREDLIKYAKWDNSIKFLWRQDNVFKYLNKSDCFLFSSRYEWFPNSVMEAMACDLPIISTKFKTWIEELIWDGTWILIEKNEQKFFDAMKVIYLSMVKKTHYAKSSWKKSLKYWIDSIISQRINIV